jgi:hypothetical protein
MPYSQTISLPQSLLTQIMGFAAQYSIDGWVAAAIAQVASGGNQMYVTTYGIGIMGISIPNATALGFNATVENSNIQAGCAYLASLLQAFVGNYPQALAAYVTSVTTVQTFGGVPPISSVQDFVYNVSKLAAQAGSSSVSGQYAIQNQYVEDPVPPSTASIGNTISPSTTGLNYGSGTNPTQGAANLTQLQASVSPNLQREDATLTAKPWFADTGLITGNPRIRRSVQPVAFTVYFDRNDPRQVFQNPATGKPIEIQLNTSMTTFEITSRHVYNRTPSRTGMHITLWGMAPDLISGTGSTGVFMNQYGLTDYFSIANAPSDVIDQVESAFTAINSTQNLALLTQSEAFRVAAQDAFVEFLKLFQMNGTVYFYNQAYATDTNGTGQNLGTISETEQQAPTAWSPTTGATTFQQHSRNNDVMTRGYVSMRYRNNVFLGYFKSLSWTQDAESPFQWKFNFTFQVEKTYTAIYYPNTQVSQLSPNGQPNTPTQSVPTGT